MITPYIIEELERDLYNTEWFSLSFAVEVYPLSRSEGTPKAGCEASAAMGSEPAQR